MRKGFHAFSHAFSTTGGCRQTPVHKYFHYIGFLSIFQRVAAEKIQGFYRFFHISFLKEGRVFGNPWQKAQQPCKTTAKLPQNQKSAQNRPDKKTPKISTFTWGFPATPMWSNLISIRGLKVGKIPVNHDKRSVKPPIVIEDADSLPK